MNDVLNPLAVPEGSLLFILEDQSATFIGYCQPVAPHDPTPLFEENGFLGVMQPIRVIQGMKQIGPNQVEKVFNSYPTSVVDWVDVLFVKPTRYYLAGPQAAKVHQDSWKAFYDEYQRNRIESEAGIVLATSDQLGQIEAMRRQITRRH